MKRLTFDDLKKLGIVQCMSCGKVLVSAFTHDFQTCGCKNETFVDGGSAYTRIGGANMSLINMINPIKK